MQPGQFLVEKDGNKCKILGVCGEVIFLSQPNAFEFIDQRLFTKNLIKEFGFSLLEEPWKPGEDDAYWYVNMNGEVNRTEYHNWLAINSEKHEFRLKIGNAHRTREGAEAYKQKLIERMGIKE